MENALSGRFGGEDEEMRRRHNVEPLRIPHFLLLRIDFSKLAPVPHKIPRGIQSAQQEINDSDWSGISQIR